MCCYRFYFSQLHQNTKNRMDSRSWPEGSPCRRSKATQELIQWPENSYCVEDQALDIFGNTLSFMSSYSVNKVSKIPINNISSNCLDGRRSIATDKMVKTVKNSRGCYIRKRSWTSTKVTSLIDDGHVWRKYGQKEIINAKHKRNYYRCTHKFDQGCQATKQVQQTEHEPTKYKITYNRHHICNNFLSTPQMIYDSINLEDTSILLSFESNGLVDKEQVGSHFPSYLHDKSKEALSFSELTDNQPLCSLPSNLIMSDQSAPSLRSTRLAHGDVISKEVYSPIFEMDQILETIDYSENPFDLAHCELISLNYSFNV
ncbi:probable WRKY transcription factor 38 [Lactuca sativa]|uniref:probable WRKY transcription factor 38 n=1 Tax=Lactuca sativa TaxID=4236 RepID=UPI000CD81478|nr:probable WRKY transcription factor 38 [Lactuca sativa]